MLLKSHMTHWMEGRWHDVLLQTLNLPSRAHTLATQGCYGDALKALSSAGVAIVDEEIWNELLEKHPQSQHTSLAHLQLFQSNRTLKRVPKVFSKGDLLGSDLNTSRQQCINRLAFTRNKLKPRWFKHVNAWLQGVFHSPSAPLWLALLSFHSKSPLVVFVPLLLEK